MANERVNRSPLSAREGKVYLDGVLIADTCKFQVVFKPDVWSGKQLSEPGTIIWQNTVITLYFYLSL